LFGPFPAKYQELVQNNENIQIIIVHLYDSIPQKDRNQFSRISQKEMSTQDKDFIGKIMKLDPRDRPTARELLQDNWFDEAEK
jgi:serine/threonine protein kinase